jgi:hypothetical protein
MRWIPLIGLLIYTLPTESAPTPHNDLFGGAGRLTTTTDVARLTSTETWLRSADLNIGKRSAPTAIPGYNPKEYTDKEQKAITGAWSATCVFRDKWFERQQIKSRCQPSTITFPSKNSDVFIIEPRGRVQEDAFIELGEKTEKQLNKLGDLLRKNGKSPPKALGSFRMILRNALQQLYPLRHWEMVEEVKTHLELIREKWGALDQVNGAYFSKHSIYTSCQSKRPSPLQ